MKYIEAYCLPPSIRIDQYLAQKLQKSFSRTYIQKLIYQKKVILESGSPIDKPSFKSKEPLHIKVELEKPKEYTINPISLGIPIIFQNDDFAVLNKPAGLTVHPGAGVFTHTLVHALKADLNSLSDISPLRPGIVHRLDKDTSGIMIIAKNNTSHMHLSNYFKERTINKMYECWVWGEYIVKDYLVEGYISRHPQDRTKMRFIFKKEKENDRLARLILNTMKSSPLASHLEVRLLTGRTHQIRTTLQTLKHPIIQDSLYGISEKNFSKLKASASLKSIIRNMNLLLYAKSLSFIDTYTNENFSFLVEPPVDFLSLEKELLELYTPLPTTRSTEEQKVVLL